jgi:hypothetical protein
MKKGEKKKTPRQVSFSATREAGFLQASVTKKKSWVGKKRTWMGGKMRHDAFCRGMKLVSRPLTGSRSLMREMAAMYTAFLIFHGKEKKKRRRKENAVLATKDAKATTKNERRERMKTYLNGSDDQVGQHKLTRITSRGKDGENEKISIIACPECKGISLLWKQLCRIESKSKERKGGESPGGFQPTRRTSLQRPWPGWHTERGTKVPRPDLHTGQTGRRKGRSKGGQSRYRHCGAEGRAATKPEKRKEGKAP